jgi:hypothetical protein
MDEQRGKQVAEVLFIEIIEIEIEVGDRGPPSVAQANDILYD